MVAPFTIDDVLFDLLHRFRDKCCPRLTGLRQEPGERPGSGGSCYPTAFALIASNSAWVMAPLSSSCLAFSISAAGPLEPAVWRT
jgi:hypothetical protein